MTIKTQADYFATLRKFDKMRPNYFVLSRYSQMEHDLESYLLRRLGARGLPGLEMTAPNKKLAALHGELSASVETLWLQRWTGKHGNAESLRAEAAAKYILWTRRRGALKQRMKQDGRVVRCAYCGHWFQSSATERIKPRGSTRYLRLCQQCAKTAKMAKL